MWDRGTRKSYIYYNYEEKELKNYKKKYII